MKFILSLSLSFIFILGFSQGYSLKDYYKSDIVLDNKTDSIFNLLNDTSRVGQMIVPAIGRLGKSRDHVLVLAKKGWIGGILLLNGLLMNSQMMYKSTTVQ
jgi:beta-N-acetylhexosaminidase